MLGFAASIPGGERVSPCERLISQDSTKHLGSCVLRLVTVMSIQSRTGAVILSTNFGLNFLSLNVARITGHFFLLFVVARIETRPVTEHDQFNLPSPYPGDMLKPAELHHVWQASTTQRKSCHTVGLGALYYVKSWISILS